MNRNKFYLLLSLLFFIPFLINAQALRDKIGQMVWIGMPETTLHDSTEYDLTKRNLGGVILFAWNMSNPNQIRLLIDSIKMKAKTPPFVAVDQEGGKVARLGSSNGFSNTNSAYTLGTVFNKEDSTRRTAAMMAGWLKQVGFNVNLAPVVDVNVNPTSPAIGKLERSFSSDPETVAKHALWFIDEFEKKNIITSTKHFPGHGNAIQDSHLGFTDITKTWTSAELIPYQQLISKSYRGMVMTGHLFNQIIDSQYPASLSSKTILGVLRTQLGFNGVVITDGMQMSAITQNYGFETAVEYAVNAGNDILLYTGTLRNKTSLAAQIINIIEQRVAQGKIPISRIDESYARIMQLKKKFGIVTSMSQLANVPSDFKLYQNYPNPFNPSTVISWQLAVGSYVTLKVYDVLGREVETLVDEYKQPGKYSVEFRTKSEERRANIASAVYYYKLTAGNYNEVRKMLLLK